MLGHDRREKGVVINGEEDVLMTSMVLAGHATLPGSFLTTSAVLKIPWMEHALTLNW